MGSQEEHGTRASELVQVFSKDQQQAQGIPWSCPGMRPKPGGCYRSFWTCLLGSHSSFTQVAMVRHLVGVLPGLFRETEVFLRTPLWLGGVEGVG